jgi:hypothetical protein
MGSNLARKGQKKKAFSSPNLSTLALLTIAHLTIALKAAHLSKQKRIWLGEELGVTIQ